MEATLSKTQVNGTGYLVFDGTANDAVDDLNGFAHAVCELNGTVGGEGLAFITGIRGDAITVEPYSSDGRSGLFSVNAVLASTVCYGRSLKRSVVFVSLLNRTYKVGVHAIDAYAFECQIGMIAVEAAPWDNLQAARAWTGASRYKSSIRDARLFEECGRLHCILIFDKSIDEILANIWRELNDVAGSWSDNTSVSLMLRLHDREVFLRIYAAGGCGLVTSCGGAIAAAAMPSVQKDVGDVAASPSEVTIYKVCDRKGSLKPSFTFGTLRL